MKSILKNIIAVSVLSLLCFSCSDNNEVDKNVSVINMEKENKSKQFDKYLTEIYTKPYNINFLYRWSDTEADMNYSLVPPKEIKAIQMANLIKYLFLDVYDAVAPKNFLKKYCPKMIMLVGSAGYRTDWSSIAGNAEGGLKITLYDINSLNPTKVDKLFDDYFRTMYHEFSHILHQKIDYPNDFDKISQNDYKSGSWQTAWDGKYQKDRELSALKKGFVSTYSSKEPNDDFVETFAEYVISTEERWNKTLEEAGEEGKAILLRKISIIRTYFLEVWQIDIDKLRAELQSKVEGLDKIDLSQIEIKK